MIKRIKQWIKSKTAWGAVFIGGLPIVIEQYIPEVKDVITNKFGLEYGVAYGFFATIIMLYFRSITTTSIRDK